MKAAAFLLALGLFACGGTRQPKEPAPPCSEAVRPVPPESRAVETRARLVVWLTIDQLRGDSFSRFAHLVTSKGFGHLLEGGLHFTNATYAHAITETAPGHATLFTGASPREHGIIANEWLTDDGQLVASVADPTAPLLGPALDPNEDVPGAGRSPRNLLLPTIGDAVRQRSLGRSKVASVSLKDRGAILPAGHAGQAFWLGKQSFVTSRYFATEVPGLLVDHTSRHPLSSYASGDWSLLLPESVYVSKRDRPRVGARTEGFPHSIHESTSPASWLRSTPMGDVAVLDLAEHVFESLALGQDEFVDFLNVSLSSNDYVGHAYGPESLEAEDTFARLDQQLSRFFSGLENELGAEHILYVLSADHGIEESPESQVASGLPAFRLTLSEFEEAARQALEKLFGHDRFLRGVAAPGLYLDHAAIRGARQELATVRALLASELTSHPAIYRAYALGAPSDGSDVGAHVVEALLEGRSGDVYVVTAPHVQLGDTDTASTHGSPWFLDRHVPIVLHGPGVPAGTVARPVDVRALAGTVADLLGMPPPAGASEGRLFSASSALGPSD